MKEELKDQFICSLHAEVIKICRKYMRKVNAGEYEGSSDTIKVNISDLLTIMDNITAAKTKGSHMESRLVKYYMAIKSLGFERKAKCRKK